MKKIVLDVPIKKKKGNNNQYKQKKEIDKRLRSLKKQNEDIENEIANIEKEIKTFNQLLSEVNKENFNKPINYNDYDRLNDLLNIQLEKWEKIQGEINKLTN